MKTTILARAIPRRAVLSQAVPCVGGLALMWWMMRQAGEAGVSGLLPGLGAIAPWQWGIALVFTTISYGAIGRYDRALHGWLGTGIDPLAAERGGRAAIAMSQMTGLGLVTGTLARWYLLPDLSLARAATVTAAVGASFLSGLVIVGAAVGLASGILPPPLALAAWAIVGLAVAAVPAIVALPRRGWARALPPLPRAATVVGLVMLDVLSAGIAFGVLIGSLDPAVVASAVLALGAGLIAATPAGVGGFEAALAGLMPGMDVAQLMTAALAFHLIYFAVPGVAAACVVLVRPGFFRRPSAPAARIVQPAENDLMTQAARAGRAEAALVAQPGNAALVGRDGRLLSCLRRGRSSVIAFAATDGGAPLAELAAVACREGRTALAYKIAPRAAATARAGGWAVRRCGIEAWLAPHGFTTEGPARRQLRRKLRHAAKAGLTVERLRTPLPWAALDRIDADWRDSHGGARGCSMGRLCENATARQVLYLARTGGQAVAFVSFHATPHERTLDLMRLGPAAPDGTMHALVVAAIADAARDQVPRLSLAAVPEQPLPAAIRPLFERGTGAAGLRQFKASFAPHWTPLYAAAPGPSGLALGLADVGREIVAET